MSTILAIETSTELASAALLFRGSVLVSETTGVHTHSQTILPLVQNLLKQASVSLKQCDALAFGAVPGSFTGVRTVCGVVQGLGFGADIRVVPVVTLLAMAEACREVSSCRDVLVLLDARMDEVYWAQYRYEDDWHVVIAPTLSSPEKIMPDGLPTMCGNGLNVYSSKLAKSLALLPIQENIVPHAKQIAMLAQTAVAKGNTLSVREAEPLYLRNKVALTTAERLAKVK